MKIESFKSIFQQKNIKLSTNQFIHSVNKFSVNKYNHNDIKAFMLSTDFVDKL